MLKSGMVFRAPIARPVSGEKVQLLMPDGTPVPNVRSVTMRYEAGGLPVCIVELLGVQIEHTDL
jgi:hypothetical protein